MYCDESGIDGQQSHVGFGSLWLPWERRGSLTGLVNEARITHRYNDEIKWNKVREHSLPFYRALVDAFFEATWLCFHAIVVRKKHIDMSLHESRAEAYLKFFATFLANKIRRSASLGPSRRYYVRVDPLPSSYAKEHEKEQNIISSMIKRELGQSPIERLDVRDSKATPGIQLADLLIGATMARYQDQAKANHKKELSRHVATHLGWTNMNGDTYPGERKFNIWYFYDKRLGPREVEPRRVRLARPLPPTSFPKKVSTNRDTRGLP
ncbi:hypothetical protein BE17_00920 [Sorangium cellulosum]|uniref:DUF3800 domain-containing protein n=1 Tax=Sorangium cellulosum TaxID=56 RepID=A0A150SQ92_SORCE|nr:hypothetical protein BE17_00920 [Sorangium cellulosum]